MSRPITTHSSPTLQIPSFSRLALQTHKIQAISCHSSTIKTRPLCSHNQTLKRLGLFLDSRDRKLGFLVNAENGEGQGKRDDVFDDGERGESTMPERFRYLTKEAPDPPVKWPWFVALGFLTYAWRAVLFELGNWKRGVIAIIGFVGYLLKLLLAGVFHFIGDPITSLIRCVETAIYTFQAFYSGIVRSAPIPELTLIITLASAVLAIGEAAAPNSVRSQSYLLSISGLIGYAAVRNYISEPLFWTLLLGLYAFSRFVKKRDDVTSALPAAAVLTAIGEPWVRVLVMVSYLALAISYHSKQLAKGNEEVEVVTANTSSRVPVPLLGAALAIGIHVAAKWAVIKSIMTAKT